MCSCTSILLCFVVVINLEGIRHTKGVNLYPQCHSLYLSRSTDCSFVKERNKIGEHVWKAINNDCICKARCVVRGSEEITLENCPLSIFNVEAKFVIIYIIMCTISRDLIILFALWLQYLTYGIWVYYLTFIHIDLFVYVEDCITIVSC